jgi:hypothetical protein
MTARQKFARPADEDYYVEPWTDQQLQGDVFRDVPFGFVAPPDAVVVDEGLRRFITGPFDAGPAMLISPSCAIAAQGPDLPPGSYAHPARILIPLRPVADLLDARAVNDENLGMLRADRLRNYLYVPEGPEWPESAGLLYMPITMHHDVFAGDRVAQLTGVAYWHLRVKLMVFFGGFVVHPDELGPPPAPQDRVH